MAEMITGLRNELGAIETPFIAGELGEFLADHETCRAFFKTVNGQSRSLLGRMPFYSMVNAAGLTDKGDSLHFDSASLREFGLRYAQEYLRIADQKG